MEFITNNGMCRLGFEESMTPQEQRDELLLIAHQEDCNDLGIEPLS